MSIVGFNFTKINAERKNAVVGTVNISNNIAIREITEAKLGLAGRGALRISFTFKSEYSPNLAQLTFDGDVLVLVDAKQVEELIASWTKSRQVPRQIAEPVMNHILDRCNIQALLVSKDLNLPSPVPLPKVRVQTPADAKPKAEEKPKPKKK
jgi:hypothetical protein